MNILKKWLACTSSLGMNLVFPGVCALCGVAHSQALALCVPCQDALPCNVIACRKCGMALPRITEECGRCQRKALLLEEIRAPFHYQHPLDALILRFKRGGDLACGQLLAELFCRQTAIQGAPELLIPVPLHIRRLRDRGFDQATQLALSLGAHYRVPVANVLDRVRDTGSQAGLSAVQRKLNVRAAFRVNREIQAKHVVLIDDVATTGATLNACALALKRAGVLRVDAWVLARA